MSNFPSLSLLLLHSFGTDFFPFVFGLTKDNGEEWVVAHTRVDTKVIGKWVHERGIHFWSLKLGASMESPMAESWRWFWRQNRTLHSTRKSWPKRFLGGRDGFVFYASKPIKVSIWFWLYSFEYSCVFLAWIVDSWDLMSFQHWYLEPWTSLKKLGFQIG